MTDQSWADSSAFFWGLQYYPGVSKILGTFWWFPFRQFGAKASVFFCRLQYYLGVSKSRPHPPKSLGTFWWFPSHQSGAEASFSLLLTLVAMSTFLLSLSRWLWDWILGFKGSLCSHMAYWVVQKLYILWCTAPSEVSCEARHPSFIRLTLRAVDGWPLTFSGGLAVSFLPVRLLLTQCFYSVQLIISGGWCFYCSSCGGFWLMSFLFWLLCEAIPLTCRPPSGWFFMLSPWSC